MVRARYIEVDASWWSGTAHAPGEPAALFDALEDDGWEAAGTGEHRRLFVRRFGSEIAYRDALAMARFKVAEHLSDRARPPS